MRHWLRIWILCLLPLSCFAELHGDTFNDSHDWIRTLASHDDWQSSAQGSRLRDLIAAENKRAQLAFAPLATEIQTIETRALAALPAQRDVFIVRRGDFDYWKRHQRESQQPIVIQRSRHNGAERTIRLRPKSTAEQGLELVDISDDGKLAAIWVDTGGGYRRALRVVNLQHPEQDYGDIDWFEGSAIWAPDNRTLYYLKADPIPANTPFFPRFHWYRWFLNKPAEHLATAIADDGTDLYRSSDKRFAILVEGNVTQQKVTVLDLHDAAAKPTPLVSEVSHRFSVDHGTGGFFIRSDHEHPSGKVYQSKDIAPMPKWQVVYTPPAGRSLEQFFVLGDVLALTLRGPHVPVAQFLNLATGALSPLSFSDAAHSVELVTPQDAQTGSALVFFTSMREPQRLLEVTLGSHKISEFQSYPGARQDNWLTERLLATAKDGTSVPILVVRKKDTKPGPTVPLLLYGYGAHNNPQDARYGSRFFDVAAILENGGTFAVAQIRGGGELGLDWYRAGTGVNRRTSIDDFISAAQHLIAQNYTSSRHLGIAGASSGGTLIAAAMNAEPDLFRAAYLGVPYVDLITDLRVVGDTDTQGLVDLGDVRKLEDYQRIKLLDPYRNLRQVRYPATLIETASNDTNVPFWHAVKYAAALRASARNPEEIVLRVSDTGGHAGPPGVFDRIKVNAERTAWLLSQIK
jgi:oligopeptidase B